MTITTKHVLFTWLIAPKVVVAVALAVAWKFRQLTSFPGSQSRHCCDVNVNLFAWVYTNHHKSSQNYNLATSKKRFGLLQSVQIHGACNFAQIHGLTWEFFSKTQILVSCWRKRGFLNSRGMIEIARIMLDRSRWFQLAFLRKQSWKNAAWTEEA